MKVTFQKSLRPLVTRSVVAGIVVFVLAKVLTVASWSAAFLFAVAVAGGYALVLWARDFRRRRIVVDDGGIEQAADDSVVRIRWEEAAGIDLEEADVLLRKSAVRIRYAAVRDVWGKKIAFSDFSLIGGRPLVLGREGMVVSDIAHPEMLLAICAHRLGSEEILTALKREEEAAQAEEAADEVPAGGEGKEGGRKRSVSLTGLLVLLGKLGGKLLKGVAAVFKTVKPGFAIATGAVYGLFFSWKFAAALMLMLLVHEYGHVHAMKRSGLKVRGIYFIPMLGAAAVTDETWRTRAQQAYIALSGPLWGFVLTLVPVAVLPFVGEKHLTFVAGVAAWWAFINLFNLLPINPLDGGRLLSSLSYSISGTLGRAVSLAAFIVCLVLAVGLEVYLFAVLGLVGMVEFFAEVEVSRQARQIELAGGVGQVGAEGLAVLRSRMRPLFSRNDEVKLHAMDVQRFRKLIAMTRISPMKGAAAVRWVIAYLLLTAAFVGVILLLSHRPEAAFITEILK
jgi:Zn-dependent protease